MKLVALWMEEGMAMNETLFWLRYVAIWKGMTQEEMLVIANQLRNGQIDFEI